MQEVNLKRIGRRISDQPHKLGEEDQVAHEVLSLLYKLQQADPQLRGRVTELALELSQSLHASSAARSLALAAKRMRCQPAAAPIQ